MAFPDKLVIADDNLHTFIQAYQVRPLLPSTDAGMAGLRPLVFFSARGHIPTAMLLPSSTGSPSPMSPWEQVFYWVSISACKTGQCQVTRHCQRNPKSSSSVPHLHAAALPQVLVKVGDLNRRRVVHAVEQQLSPPSNDSALSAAQANGHTTAMIAAQPVTALAAAASHASSSPDAGQQRRWPQATHIELVLYISC